MKKMIRNFIVLQMILLLFCNVALGGEAMKAGTILKNDSYVFTIDEAQRLQIRLDELEKLTLNQEEIIGQYQMLDELLQSENQAYQELLDLSKLQVNEYQQLHQMDLERISTLEKQQKLAKLEKGIYFGTGLLFSVLAIIVADKVDDGLEK